MQITVLLFARLRDVVGTSELTRDLPTGSTNKMLWNLLSKEFKELQKYDDIVSVAVNTEYSNMNQTLRDGDEVAFLPPVSGG